jgi:hypothetical protein
MELVLLNDLENSNEYVRIDVEHNKKIIEKSFVMKSEISKVNGI